MRPELPAAALALLLASSGARGAGVDKCQRLIDRGEGERAATCFLNAWRGGAPAAHIAARLAALRASGRAGGWLLEALGTLQAVGGDPEAEATFASAVELFVRSGDRRGEAIARAWKGIYYSRSRRFAESEDELRRADAAAAASGRPEAIGRVRIAEAQLCQQREDPLGGLERLAAGEAAAQASGDDDLLSDWYEMRGKLLWAAGRFPESIESYRLQIAALERLGERGRTATALSDMAIVARDKPSRIAFAREALDRAVPSGNLEAEVTARFTLAEVEEGAAALDQALAALAAARRLGTGGRLRLALRAAGYRLVENGRREEGLALLREAVESAIASGDRSEEARCRFVLSRALWEFGTRKEAIRESLASLDAAEATRRSPASATSRTARFAQWGNLYYRAAGYLLSGALLPQGAEVPADEVALAFRIAERMKARALLDALDGGASVSDVAGAASEFVSLDDLREALAPDEALLSFLINGERTESGQAFNGGSWVFAVTRAGTRVFRLVTDRRLLQDQERLFIGLIESRQGDEAQGAVALHATLFAAALASLPPGVGRLLVVPDRALHSLPLGLLRPASDAEPLAARYEIVSVPSATVWLRLRRLPAGAAAALSLSDPSLPAQTAAVPVSSVRAGSFGSLDHARREGRALVRRAGPGSRFLAGPEATEAALKTAQLASYGVLHFGAHAVSDDRDPQRTALLLGAGAGEDGTLRIEEIRRLPLSGQLVALSACRSATGAYFVGDGYVGLTSAFLLAGSRAVLGTLWPVRDDEAEEFADAFYAELGRPGTASRALAAAQQGQRKRGRPAATWAAFVLIGDGSLAPLRRAPGPEIAPLLVLAAAGTLAAIVLLRLRRPRGQPLPGSRSPS